MHFRSVALLSLSSLVAVDAYRDTSPFFLFSTNDILGTSKQIQSSSSLLDSLTSTLSTCPSETYILVNQPGVHVQDYQSRKAAPRLRERILANDGVVRSSFVVSEVVGELKGDELGKVLEEKCQVGVVEVDGASGSIPSLSTTKKPQLIKVTFPSLPTDSQRAQQLLDNDSFLSALLDLLASRNFSVLYTTTPASSPPTPETDPYEMDSEDTNTYPNQVHLEMKRDILSHAKRAEGDDNNDDGTGDDEEEKLPLFEKYQFLSPGIFMGLIAMLIFISILYVGLSALTSLQVSYAAFSKESGPGTTKKQQ